MPLNFCFFVNGEIDGDSFTTHMVHSENGILKRHIGNLFHANDAFLK